jgi:hypothetical protein
MALRVRIRSLKNQTLNTGVASYSLMGGQVITVLFKNRSSLDSLIELGVIEKYNNTLSQKVSHKEAMVEVTNQENDDGTWRTIGGLQVFVDQEGNPVHS